MSKVKKKIRNFQLDIQHNVIIKRHDRTQLLQALLTTDRSQRHVSSLSNNNDPSTDKHFVTGSHEGHSVPKIHTRVFSIPACVFVTVTHKFVHDSPMLFFVPSSCIHTLFHIQDTLNTMTTKHMHQYAEWALACRRSRRRIWQM